MQDQHILHDGFKQISYYKCYCFFYKFGQNLSRLGTNPIQHVNKIKGIYAYVLTHML